MKIRVRYFALFREQAGCGAETVNWSGGTAIELFQAMGEQHTLLQTQAAALVAINDEMTAAGRRYIAAASVADLTDNPGELALPAAPRN